jgi:predicted membrane channel-forming protein YqfA (hemolysin III family)
LLWKPGYKLVYINYLLQKSVAKYQKRVLTCCSLYFILWFFYNMIFYQAGGIFYQARGPWPEGLIKNARGLDKKSYC